ncbi:hypothetical protein LS73_005965 [Helicobacter muridarum]|uniref:Lipoprotein n=1 Tax=Helicobacter muridarum TaxID=216 RepID=A0A377PTZ4_9HELI|nr:hypothetical protein [Helicobacter muridarum]TLE00075.1 hypothetical protein LS73_005965 [Helicobacter muridarum]STQ86077.1 Uncharacterised protein [Helicobacter muridarum]
MRIIALISICISIVALMCACSRKDVISLGTMDYYKPLKSSKLRDIPNKPINEIARICNNYSIFTKNKIYETMTLENLLKKAIMESNKEVFHNVAIWQKSWNIMYLFGQKCLILGEIKSLVTEETNRLDSDYTE